MNCDVDGVAGAVIENCRLVEPCAQRWDALEALPGEPQVRFCSRCQSAVHLAMDAQREAELAQQGKCFAVARDAQADTACAPVAVGVRSLCAVAG